LGDGDEGVHVRRPGSIGGTGNHAAQRHPERYLVAPEHASVGAHAGEAAGLAGEAHDGAGLRGGEAPLALLLSVWVIGKVTGEAFSRAHTIHEPEHVVARFRREQASVEDGRQHLGKSPGGAGTQVTGIVPQAIEVDLVVETNGSEPLAIHRRIDTFQAHEVDQRVCCRVIGDLHHEKGPVPQGQANAGGHVAQQRTPADAVLVPEGDLLVHGEYAGEHLALDLDEDGHLDQAGGGEDGVWRMLEGAPGAEVTCVEAERAGAGAGDLLEPRRRVAAAWGGRSGGGHRAEDDASSLHFDRVHPPRRRSHMAHLGQETMSANTAPLTDRFEVHCESCGGVVPPRPYHAHCPACDGTLGFRYRAGTAAALPESPRRMWDFAALLPVETPVLAVTLDEGGTPLVPARGDWGCRLWLKDETRNPTGSHKDRALAVAVTRGRELGFASCAVISAGSTGLSTAAYAARGGLRCAVIVPRGTPDERLLPLSLYGARIFEADGTFEDALRLVEGLASEQSLYVTSTYRRGNPYQAEGAKTIGFEIAAQLREATQRAVPDWIVVPTGGGGTAAAIWRAYQELRELGALAGGASKLPRIATVQPAAYNALELGLARGLHTETELYALGILEETPTALAKLLHGVPPDAVYALEALRESGGTATSVADEPALAAQRRLASEEGLFAEPSAAAALAGVQRLVTEGTIHSDETVVALITGSGFRELGAIGDRTSLDRTPLDEATLLPFLAGAMDDSGS
jgi:threonine synthase